MASPPVGPQPRRRVAVSVKKTTKPGVARRGLLSSKELVQPAKKSTTTRKAVTSRGTKLNEANHTGRTTRLNLAAPSGRISVSTIPEPVSNKSSDVTSDRTRASRVRATRTKTVTTTVDQAHEAVVMPSGASARLLSKATALREWYQGRFPHKVGVVCTVAGLLFTTLGGLSLIPFVNAVYPDWQSFQTVLNCQAGHCAQEATAGTSSGRNGSSESKEKDKDDDDDDDHKETKSERVPSPALSFLTKPPAVLSSTSSFIVRAEHVSDLEAVAESRTTGLEYPLMLVGQPAGPDHTFAIDAAQLSAGEYDIRVRAVASRDAKVVLMTGPRFRLKPVPSPKPADNQSTTQSPTADVGTTTLKQPEVTANLPAADDELDTDSTSEAVLPVLESPTTTRFSEQPSLSYSRPAPGIITLRVRTTAAQAVEVFAQRLNATAPIWLGSARRVEDTEWLLRYDTKTLPNGTYVLVASVKSPRGSQDSARVPLFVENSREDLSGTTSTSSETRAVVESTSALERNDDAEGELPNRQAYVETLSPVTNTSVGGRGSVSQPPVPGLEETQPVVAPLPLPTTPETLRPAIRASFSKHADSLNDLFARYASALQTNDPALRVLIEDELSKKRTRLVEEAVTTSDNEVTASDLDQSLLDEFSRLKERVETFENLLRDRTAQQSTVDLDADGISDYDEVTLYKTSPTSFDTDNDGVSDGAELMRGFDPRSSAEEAVLTYTSPKEFGIIRDDVLSIAAVTPVIETDEQRGTPLVQAEISGTAIPNSFVTLFIFSSPTVVTVRTAADGSFVYRFDKELADGTHDVYIAITDNTGDIIAKSNPFTFVKEAAAFTVVDTTTAEPVASSDPATAVSITQLYQVIMAMVVLTFGLILLIFGIAMRRQPPVIKATNTATEAHA